LEEGLIDSPRVYIVARSRDYHDIVTGKMEGITAVMTGKMKIDGDVGFMTGFRKMFKPLTMGGAAKKTFTQRVTYLVSVVKYLFSRILKQK